MTPWGSIEARNPKRNALAGCIDGHRAKIIVLNLVGSKPSVRSDYQAILFYNNGKR